MANQQPRRGIDQWCRGARGTAALQDRGGCALRRVAQRARDRARQRAGKTGAAAGKVDASSRTRVGEGPDSGCGGESQSDDLPRARRFVTRAGKLLRSIGGTGEGESSGAFRGRRAKENETDKTSLQRRTGLGQSGQLLVRCDS